MAINWNSTELGMTLDGWRYLSLSDLATIIGGGTPSRSQPAYWNGDVPWATPTDVTGLKGRVISETNSTITDEGLANSSAVLLPPCSLLMTTRATIGACAINRISMATNQGFQSLIPKEGARIEFLYYLIQHHKRRLERLAAGSTFLEVSRRAIRSFRVAVPPPHEQRKIAAILSSVDDTIEKTQSVIDQVQIVKRGLMQKLLTRGLPGRHTRFKQTEIGEIPEEWGLMSLGDVGSWSSGSTPSKRQPEYWNGTIPWVSPKDMKQTRIDDAIDHVSKSAIDKGTRVTPRDSILVVVRGMILAHTFPVALTLTDVAFNQDIKALVSNKHFVPEFLFYWLERQQKRVISLVDSSSHGTKRLPTAKLFAELVPCPQLDEQENIAQLLRSHDLYGKSATVARDGIITVKAALMPVLLTGELRVTPDPETP